MPPSRKRKLEHGVGAVVKCISRFIHPSAPICEKIPNREKNHVLEDLILTGEGEKVIRRGTQEKPVYFMTHHDFENVEFYAFKRYVTVITEGPPEQMFRQNTEVNNEAVTAQHHSEVRVGQSDLTVGNLDSSIGLENLPVTNEMMRELQMQGITVDDDNMPAEENIPLPNAPVEDNIDWNWRSEGIICPRRAQNIPNTRARFKQFSDNEI